MTDSILDSTKKVLGISPDDTDFDLDLILHINSVFSIMQHLGATPTTGFSIEDNTTTWADFLLDRKSVNMVKSYMVMKVRLMFDPPATSFAIESMKTLVSEFEWRLNTLELVFNPNAYRSNVNDTKVWVLTEGDEFPAEAESGDIGYNPETGNLWRYEP